MNKSGVFVQRTATEGQEGRWYVNVSGLAEQNKKRQDRPRCVVHSQEVLVKVTHRHKEQASGAGARENLWARGSIPYLDQGCSLMC